MMPIERPKSIKAYILVKLQTDGKFCLENTSVTEFGDLGSGFYSDLNKVQYQQTILALKGIQTHIYDIDWTL